MAFGLARLHIITMVPPGTSLIGAYPHTIFRVEEVKLTKNERLRLHHVDGRYVPFDGQRHRLRGSCGATLTIGAFVAFCVTNDGTEPEPLEMQVIGTAADTEERVAGEPAPELSHNAVLGVMAMEPVLERAPVREGGLDPRERLELVTKHYDAACEEVADAFDQACKSGYGCDYDGLRHTEERQARLGALRARAKAAFDLAVEALLAERDALGFTDEAIEQMASEVCEGLGLTREQLTERVGSPASLERLYALWFENRKPLAARAKEAAASESMLEDLTGDELGAVVEEAIENAPKL